VEDTAEAGTEPGAESETPTPAASETKAALQTDVPSYDEDDIDIPAFLRRDRNRRD